MLLDESKGPSGLRRVSTEELGPRSRAQGRDPGHVREQEHSSATLSGLGNYYGGSPVLGFKLRASTLTH